MREDGREIVKFFASEKGFDRLLNAMFNTYVRHRRAFGAVRLTQPTPGEEAALSGFFKRDYYNQALIRIGLADFERQMQKFFNTALGLGALLEAYSGKPIAKPEPRGGVHKHSDAFVKRLRAELLPKYENTTAGAWLKEMFANTRRTYRQWVERFEAEPETVVEMVREAAEALNNLPEGGGLTRLSEFSERFTKSPYAFDISDTHGQLFLRALAFRFNLPVPYTVEDGVNLYVRAGLLAGGVLSGVTVYGLTAFTRDGAKDEVSAVYNGLKQSHVLTLENLSRLDAVAAYGNQIFIFENRLVYAAVCERLRGAECTLCCPMDGLSPAFSRLLKLTGSIELYYAGNLDYKGLAVADRLYLEFGKRLIPWRYSLADYEMIIKTGDSLLPDEKRGLAMHNEELASLLSQMRKTGKTADSLALVPFFVDDIIKLIK